MNGAQALASYPDVHIAISDDSARDQWRQRFAQRRERNGTGRNGQSSGQQGEGGNQGNRQGNAPQGESQRQFNWQGGRNRDSLSPGFAATAGEMDTRRSEMDMGLGVWTDSTARYYPLETIFAEDNAFIDEMDGQNLLIYIEPLSRTPFALYTAATNYTWEDNTLHLDTGETIHQGVSYNTLGERIEMSRPMQLFTRWYGFSYTFPGCEVYESST